jgi:sulfide:quinone oxidoreductase
MKNLVILGAGTAGTMMANRLGKRLPEKAWSITIIDQYPVHYYQPGFLFIPFGVYAKNDVVRRKKDYLPKSCNYIQSEIEVIDADGNRVKLKNGTHVDYDVLIIATGSKIVPGEIEGLEGPAWHKSIFDFYTIEGALALREKLAGWKGGRLVLHLAQMPIKCPVAPLEFLLLADWWLTVQGLRSRTELIYVTPLDSAFTKPNCAKVLGYMLTQKNIRLIPEFNVESVDPDKRRVKPFEGAEVEYDLLVSIPTNMGDGVIGRSGLGDDLDFIPTHKHTLQSKARENIFVLGDATDLPSSKAGSVAHFQSEVLTGNILNYIGQRPLLPGFDGHANCFIESGFGKAFLIDFNYDIEPVEGKFPVPGLGPFSLLKETRLNHLGKMAFKWMYWNLLLRGRPMPGITVRMQKAGKKL